MEPGKKYKIMRIVALVASILTAFQAASSLITGSSICPDAGCKTVESLTAISPLYLNVLGFIFFQVVFWLLYFLRSRTDFNRHLMGLLLLSGLAFDSALLGYQLFAAHSLCSYCLLIWLFVMSLNILYGGRQTVAGFAISSAVIISFSVMVLFPAGAGSNGYSLKHAAYGLKSCASPTKEIYLIFSSDCPHCQKVIDTLNNCNSCDLYLNPISPISVLNLDGLELNKGFSPRINRHILSVLGIDRIPVLVVKDEESYRFIRGENRILNFIRRACFTHDEVLYLDQSPQTVDKGITVLTEADEECSVEIDCEPKQDEKPLGNSISN
jgi:uncharacterized membrane protein